jgi:SAM-dependent methyltransferase
MVNRYWRGPAEDTAMQDEHAFIWEAMLQMVDTDLSGRKALDAGCNRGGFLRLLSDRACIAEGFGYDPAPGAIEDARRLAGSRPLTFEASATVPEGWSGFDIAFSHEVLYLIYDLPDHAAALYAALAPGAAYFATMGVHADSRLSTTWHGDNAVALDLPGPYRLDDVADVFKTTGFDVAVGRLPFRFVPVDAHRTDHPDFGLNDWLDYYYQDKVMFRFVKPG